MSLQISPNRLCEVTTEEDPDGADRGGYHQETQSLTLDGNMLLVDVEVSDYYEERLGDLPGPIAESKDDAKHYAEELLKQYRQTVVDLEAFLVNLEKVESIVIRRSAVAFNSIEMRGV